MDRILRPDRFEVEPTCPNSEKSYRHWKLTLQNYIRSHNNGLIENTSDNFFALINCISASVFDLISDKTDYDSALRTLDAAYLKPENIVYNRYRLMTTKQQTTQNIDAFILQLEMLAKTCNFEAVSAEENKNQYIREAFIGGISSSSIRQRLLEKPILTLQDTYATARSLEQAEKHSISYANNFTVAATNNPSGYNRIAVTKENMHPKGVCFFCGKSRHPRYLCPARNAECKKCKKNGHWAKVCKSSISNTHTAVLYDDSDYPSPSLS